MRERFLASTAMALALVVSPLSVTRSAGPVDAARTLRRPSAPRDVRVVADPGYIRVLFRPPASNGGAPVESYRINVEPLDTSRFCFASDCFIQIAGGKTIRIDVAAVNAVGAGPASPLSRWFTTLPRMKSSSPAPSPYTPRPFLTPNWAGYAATKGHFTSASAQFVVPTVGCTSRTAELAQWVGIDGYGSKTVEQDGITVTCTDGSPSYSAYYEMWGNLELYDGNPVTLNERVAPGDLMVASVSEANAEWTFVVSDLTQGWTSSNVVAMPSPTTAQASAEFIVEAPLFFCTEGFPCADFTLPAFTATTFSNIAVTENHDTSGGLPSNPTTCDLTVANSTVTLAAPSALSGEGTSFSVSAGPGAGAG